MEDLSDEAQPIWRVLEADSTGRAADDAAHWIGVYTNLLTLLDKGAAVRIGDRAGAELLGVRVEEVRERLDYWQARLDAAVAAS